MEAEGEAKGDMTTAKRTAAAVLLASVLCLVACPVVTLLALTGKLGNTVALLASINGNTELAQRMKEHTATATRAIQNWQPGQSASEVIRAINAVIDDINGLPMIDRNRPLIVFALGTAANIIETIKARGGTGEEPHTDIKLTDPPKTEKEFCRVWNDIRAGSPGLEQAPVIKAGGER